MPVKIQKRRDFLINLVFLIAVLAIAYIFFKYLFWITAPFLLSFFFAIILQRPVRLLDRKTNNKMHSFWCILLILLSICIVILPLALLITALVSKISDIVKYFTNQLNDLPTFLATFENEILAIVKHLPASVQDTANNYVTTTFDRLNADFDLSALGIKSSSIKSGISSGITGVFTIVKNVPSALLSIVIGIIAWIFFTKDYNKIVLFIQKQFPEDKKNVLFEVKQVFSKTILKMFRAYGIIMFITFGELLVGFSILKAIGVMTNRYFIWIAVGIAIFDILPVAGSGGILIPWILFSFIMGNPGQAIGLIVIYGVISVIRQYIEPKIVGDSLGVHPLITLMGLYFGLKLFGFIGMFIVPITVMTLKGFNDAGRIHLWKSPDRN